MPRNILLGVTGSVAAVLTGKLVRALKEVGDVRVIFTECGKYFVEKNAKGEREFRDLQETSVLRQEDVMDESHEWPEVYMIGDPVAHIELRKWASCLVIAPLSANTLAKINYGLCDNLLTSVYRAWDWTRPIILAPAMNTMMWENDPTKEHIYGCRRRGCRIVGPVRKTLACNDEGMGAMAPIDEIVKEVKHRLRLRAQQV